MIGRLLDDEAEAQDALGNEPDCLLAARRAKQVLELP
jgi:hypothetical protein